VPSRNPASDDFEDYGMPDLPGGLFDDDEELYEPRGRKPARQQRNEAEWEDARPEPREKKKRVRRQDEEALFEDRPRRTRNRQTGGAGGGSRSGGAYRDDDSYEMRTSLSREFRDLEITFDEVPVALPPRTRQPVTPTRRRREPNRTPSGHDRVIERPRMQTRAATADVLTSIRPVEEPRPRVQRSARRRNPAWSWRPIVMPQPRQMLEQAMPNLLLAATAIGILLLMPYLPFGLPLWAPLVLLPMLALLSLSNTKVHPMWSRAALVNLVTVGAFFPIVIVRQSVLRVPFVEWGNGTLAMPVLATVGVLLLLGLIALGSAFLCEEDPEYAGIVFLPAALLVPFFAGATEITSLSTAFVVLAAIYLVSAVLTVVASMLPGAFPTLVAPIALALEFLVLPLAGNTPIFPVGAGLSAKLMFFALLFVAVGLTISVPMMAVWVRQVRRIVVAGGSRGQFANLAA